MAIILSIVLIVWLVILQNKLSRLSAAVEKIEKTLLKEDKEQISEPKEEAIPAFINTTNEDISDILQQELAKENSSPVYETHPQPVQEAAKEIATGAEPEESASFENIFLGNIFNKIGALAILIGLIILIKIVSPYLIFTPVMKISLGYLAGAIMLFAAFKLHPAENMKNYAEVLLGTGFGAMFISTYCAGSLFKLFNMPVTCIIATLFLLASFYLADRLKTVSMLVISLIAAYLNPILLNSTYEVSQNFMFGYLIFTNLLSVLYTCKNRSKNIINPINLFITFILATVYCNDINIAAPVILWAIYLIYDLISNTKAATDIFLNYWNLAIFSGFLYSLAYDQYDLMGLIQLAVLFVYAIIAYIKKSDEKVFKNYLYMGLISALLCVMFLAHDSAAKKCFIWSAQAVILSYYSAKYRFKELAGIAAGMFVLAFCTMLPVDGVFAAADISKYTPVKNIRLAMFLPVIVSSVISCSILAKSKEEALLKIAEFFRFCSLTSIFLYTGLETNAAITKHYLNTNISAGFINCMVNSVLGFAYAISLRYLNKIINSKAVIPLISVICGLWTTMFMLLAGYGYKPVSAFVPVLNIRTAAFAFCIATFLVYNSWFKNSVFKTVFKYAAILTGFIFVHYEIVDIIAKYFADGKGEYLISLSWILYSGLVTAAGILKNQKYLKNSGIFLCILSIIRIFIYDLANVDILYKLIAFLTLGVILMAISYLYNKLAPNK